MKKKSFLRWMKNDREKLTHMKVVMKNKYVCIDRNSIRPEVLEMFEKHKLATLYKFQTWPQSRNDLEISKSVSCQILKSVRFAIRKYTSGGKIYSKSYT